MGKQLSVNSNWGKSGRAYECVLREGKNKKREKGRKGKEWKDMDVHSSIIPLQLVAAVKRNH